MPNTKIVFERCIIEECGSIVQRAGTVILEECQVKNGGTGIARCRVVQISETPVSDTDTVVDSCVSVVLDESPLDKCGRVLNAVDKAVVQNLAITNARAIIFTDVKELNAVNLKIENGRNVGQGISGQLTNVTVRDCEMGVNAGGRLVLTKVTFNNIKGTAIMGKGSTIQLQTVEIAFAGTAIADVFDLQAEGLTIKVCRNGLLGIDKAVISDSKITQTENTVFDTIAQLSLDTVEIKEGGTLAKRCTVSFEEVKISAFASSFVENLGDLRMSDSSLTGIGGPAIDANGFKVKLDDVKLSSCPAGVINSPLIEAENLVVENCTGGLIPPAPAGAPKAD